MWAFTPSRILPLWCFVHLKSRSLPKICSPPLALPIDSPISSSLSLLSLTLPRFREDIISCILLYTLKRAAPHQTCAQLQAATHCDPSRTTRPSPSSPCSPPRKQCAPPTYPAPCWSGGEKRGLCTLDKRSILHPCLPFRQPRMGFNYD